MTFTSDPILSALLVVLLLQAKHVVCDGPLQTLAMVKAKGHYGRPLGIAHAAIHAAGTAVVLLVAGVTPTTAAALALLDGVVHYHIDFTKETIVRVRGWTVQDGPFWWMLTGDQALHHAGYLALAYLVARL